jgi:DNA-binding Lrp family transcriptional regulator
MNQQLTGPEISVLVASQMDWRLDTPALSRITGLKSHTINYAAKRIYEKKIARPFVMYNIHRVGLTDYCVFFNIQSSSNKCRETVLNFCVQSSQTTYVAELTGKYQYSVSIMAHSIFEVERFFDGLMKHLDKPSLKLSFGIRAQWTIMPVKYLLPGPNSGTPLTRTENGDTFEIEPDDERMLALFSKDPSISLNRLATKLGVPYSTLRYRLDHLERKQLILGYPLAINAEKLGRFPLRVLIVARGIDSRFRSELFSFASAHPLCTMFVRCLGAWDFELKYDLENLAQGGEIVQELNDHFGPYIQSTSTVTELGVWKFHEWPLRKEASN